MNLFRKFYDIDAPDQVATPSIAQLMATQGVVNTTQNPIAQAIDISKTENQEPPTATEPTPVASTTETPIAEQVQESPTPTPEATPTATAPIEPPKVAQPTWQEVLKQQPEVVLNELGYDAKTLEVVNAIKENPKMVAFIEHWKNNGDVKQYLQELTTDYNKMPPEDVMRHQLRMEYPKASEAALDALYEDEIISKYKQDPDLYTEEEVTKGKLLLEARADKYRDALAKEQEKFLIPPPPEKAPAVDNSAAEREQQVAAYRAKVTESQYAKSILSTNQVTIGEGEDKFNYPVNPQELFDTVLDDKKWAEGIFQQAPNGEFVPDVEKLALLGLVNKYGKQFLNEYAKHYRSLGAKAAIEPIVNVKPPESNNPSASPVNPTNPAEAMAKNGKLVNGISHY